ncbi:hypothetical protein BDY19DRAFT_959720 [Irpex rosettiformis]|uniref:Uncharacterized protein n=1 Tax=Irpex rosettiformis TaxID=378272 RepID=A0ACB8TXC4_9APHY|nr:hypothetical protein BDY19DRAFT_959720 [Irpex rosettiformis]
MANLHSDFTLWGFAILLCYWMAPAIYAAPLMASRQSIDPSAFRSLGALIPFSGTTDIPDDRFERFFRPFQS